MRLYLPVILFYLMIILPQSTFGQKPNQSLLWRITGKHITQPSYLFGTMHLRDKRLFEFDDSVYYAIEKTEGFAIEVDLNEMAGYIMNGAFKSLTEEEIEFDDSEYNELLKEFEDNKEAKKMLKKITKASRDKKKDENPFKDDDRWVYDYFKKDQMPTFVDGYLYTIAKRQGKWMGGIEDINDHLDAVNSKETEGSAITGIKNPIEKMISLYADQDIEEIYKLISQNSKAFMDEVFINRNIKMAKNMDSMTAERSMFFAIGAGHLPGDSGVINLLKERGFTVEPVFSKNKIKTEDYTYKEVPQEWVLMTDSINHYSISMPGKPAKINLYGLAQMRFVLDLSNLSGYCTMSMVEPGIKGHADSALRAYAAGVYGEQQTRSAKKIMQDSSRGLEFVIHKDSYFARLRFFNKGNTVYMAMVYAHSKDDLYTDDTKRFFRSIKFDDIPETEHKIYVFTDSVAGYTTTLPVQMTENKELLEKTGDVDGWNVLYYSGVDRETGAYVMFINKQTEAGTYIEEDSATLEQLHDLMKKYKPELEWTTVDGYRAIRLRGKEKSGLYLNLLSYVKGNKNNIFMLLTNEEYKDSPEILQILNNVKIISPPERPWNKYSDSLNTFSTVAPKTFTISEKEYYSSERTCKHYSYDTMNAVTYFVITDTLSQYIWVNSDSLFLDNAAKSYYTERDSLVSQKLTKQGGDKRLDALINIQNSNAYHRISVIQHGRIQYTLLSESDRPTLTNKNSDLFFNKFVINYKTNFDIHKNKEQQLIKDLKSPDTATRETAYLDLKKFNFTLKDLDFLHKALFDEYPAPRSYYGVSATNEAFAVHIRALASDTTVDFLEERYKTFGNDEQEYKMMCLEILSDVKTPHSYNTLATLTVQSPPQTSPGWMLRYRLEDSLELLSGIYDKLLTLASDTAMGPLVAELTVKLIDSGYIKLNHQHENKFIQLADKLVLSLKEKEDIDFNTYSLITLLGYFNTQESLDAVYGLLDAKNLFLVKDAAFELLKRDKKVDKTVWTRLASDPKIRFDLYSELKEMDKIALFPKAYSNQKDIAESILYDYSNYDDYYPDKMVFIKEKTKTIKGVSYKFYLFEMIYNEGEEQSRYLGIVGAYNEKSKDIERAKKITRIYWDEELDRDKADEQFELALE